MGFHCKLPADKVTLATRAALTPEALQEESQINAAPRHGGHKVNARFMLWLPLQAFRPCRPKVCPPLLQPTDRCPGPELCVLHSKGR